MKETSKPHRSVGQAERPGIYFESRVGPVPRTSVLPLRETLYSRWGEAIPNQIYLPLRIEMAMGEVSRSYALSSLTHANLRLESELGQCGG